METEDFSNVEVMWKPTVASGKNMKLFMDKIRKKYEAKIDDYWDLHQWSVENIAEFWEEMWDLSQIIHSKPYDQVVDSSVKFEDIPKWFEGARLNFAENMLRYRDEKVALIITGENCEEKSVTHAQLYENTCMYAAALRKSGVKTGDRIVCYMSNREEPIYALLGATSIGAIWSATLPLIGAQAVLIRFRQIEPKILFAVDRFPHLGEEKDMLQKLHKISVGLPTLEKIVIVPSNSASMKRDISHIKNSCFLEEFLAIGKQQDGSVPPLEFEQLPFNHPVLITYTSGTSGAPKGIMHGVGGLLALNRDFCLHSNSNRSDCWLSISPPGWVSWNTLTATVAFGGTIVVYEGIPYFVHSTYLWDMVDKFNITILFMTPSVLDEMEKRNFIPPSTNTLKSLRTIFSGSSIVKPQNYDFVYKKIRPGCIFGSTFGCTEILGACMMFDKTLPLYKGEISAPTLGIELECYSDNGKSVTGQLGEFVITKPTPSLPLGIWDDKDGQIYKEVYFHKFPGMFTIGDLIIINPITKGIIVYGRSDNTLKPKGARFGSSEIYNAVEAIPEVLDSLCVSQYNQNRDERAVLFVKIEKEFIFSEDLAQRIRETIAKELTVRHVPEVIIEAKEIPYNMNGKKMEGIVKKIINGFPYDKQSVVNSECLKNFHDIAELQNF